MCPISRAISCICFRIAAQESANRNATAPAWCDICICKNKKQIKDTQSYFALLTYEIHELSSADEAEIAPFWLSQ
jgi:hypothetical protein